MTVYVVALCITDERIASSKIYIKKASAQRQVRRLEARGKPAYWMPKEVSFNGNVMIER